MLVPKQPCRDAVIASLLFLLQGQFAKAILVAHHKSHRRIITLHKVIQIKRFAKDEQAAAESVAHLQFGVFGMLNDETVVAKIAEGASAVRFP